MNLYLGNNRIEKIALNQAFYELALQVLVIVQQMRLLSSDDYELMGSDGVYLIAKEETANG